VEGAEDAQGTNYPDLEAARRREETYDFWTEMINKGFNKCRWGEDASSAPPTLKLRMPLSKRGMNWNP
jgi:hypothetical protein